MIKKILRYAQDDTDEALYDDTDEALYDDTDEALYDHTEEALYKVRASGFRGNGSLDGNSLNITLM